jgi:multidrug efflux pump subunit AcrA (membrane-fusion protein)
VGLAADPEQRTVDLIATPLEVPPWARAGVTATLEVVTDRAGESLAIPAAAVVQDGLEQVFFRRDPRDADKVIRTVADLGVSDGRWVVLNSGVKAGDEVVVEGVYELKLASAAGGPRGGGHFHADGTWHADGTPEPEAKK